MKCPRLDIGNASLTSNDTQLGSVVNVTCRPGYKIDARNNVTLRCNSSGLWEPAGFTSCLR